MSGSRARFGALSAGHTPMSVPRVRAKARPAEQRGKRRLRKIGVGTGILLPAPPSEPDGRFSRIRLSDW